MIWLEHELKKENRKPDSIAELNKLLNYVDIQLKYWW